MRKLITLGCTIMFAATSFAQQDRPKLQEIVQKHQKEMAQKPNEPITSVYENKEKGDYHFQRWLWYTKQHTDIQGYIVPKVEAYRTWRNYEALSNRAAAKTTADQSDWEAIGPFSQGGISGRNGEIGRINTMALNPQNPGEMIVGTAGGGAWKVDVAQYIQGKGAWTPITENLMSLSISDIDYNPANPNTIYICTGDREYSSRLYFTGTAYGSIGVIKTTDGGKTWDTTGFNLPISAFVNTNSLLINPSDTNSLTLATDVGIWKSFNAGATWQKAVMHSPTANYKRGRIYEVVYHPTDTSIIYATSVIDSVDQQGQLVGSPTSVELLKSTDGGMSWDVKYTIEDASRAAVAVTPASANMLKMVVANDGHTGLEGVYHSNNAGNTIFQIFDDPNCQNNLLGYAASGIGCDGQGNYDLCIAIDPTDATHVIIGGVNTWESKNGGVSWTLHSYYENQTLNAHHIHVDHHYIGFTPLGLVNCNDGGIVVIDGNSVYDITAGMNITQYYRIGSNKDGSYFVGGAQDNGSHLINAPTSISNSIMSGDGMDCMFDPVTPNIFYMSSQNGNFARWDLKKGISQFNAVSISSNINAPNDKRGAWTSPLLIDAHNHNRLITARKAVYLSDDQGDSWQAISTEFSALIGRLAMSYSAAGTIYATEDGESNNIHYTHDTGSSWTTIQHPYSDPIISDIKADYSNKESFWITFSGFGNNKNKVANYNKGTWTTMNENLPDLPVYCIVQDTSDKTLYIGTYTGVYYRTTQMNQWEKYTTKLPLVNVFDLEINYTTGNLIAGTWGRGMWQTPKYKEPVGINNVATKNNSIELYPNPSSGQFTISTTNNAFKNKKVSIQIVDVAGKTVYSSSGTFTDNQLAVATNNIAAGNYLVKLSTDNGNTLSSQIIITEQ